MSKWEPFEYAVRDFVGVRDVETDETIADVHDPKHRPLIAAAPDLLAACKMAREVMAKTPGLTSVGFVLESAIAKATT